MQEPADLVAFYDDAYSRGPEGGELYARWRELSAVGKAEHVMALCCRAGISPRRTLEIGCGDGALLRQLRRMGFGGDLEGVEITELAVEIAASRPEIDRAWLYDGLHLQVRDGAYDLAILSHVLEHVPDPAPLLAEAARAAGAVLVEVPLEQNWSARRPGKREHAAEVGHLQRLDREGARAIVRAAGLKVAGEIEDPLPLSVHLFFAESPARRAAAALRWGVRASLYRLAPAVARRVFTLHYACLCLPPGG